MPTPSLSFLVKANKSLTASGAAVVVVPVWQGLGVDSTAETAEKPAKKATKKADKPASPKPVLDKTGYWPALEALLGEALATSVTEDKFDGALGKTLVFKGDFGGGLKRVLVIGLGLPSKLAVGQLESPFARAVSAIIKLDKSLHKVALALPAPYEVYGGPLANCPNSKTPVGWADLTLHAVGAVYTATYKSDEALKPLKEWPAVTLLAEKPKSVEAALPKAQAVGTARALSKDLVNTPANIKRTQTMADAATAIGKAHTGVKVKVNADAAWIEKEMPCFFEVARGSVNFDPPRWIHLHYKGKKATKKVGLIGKSVIFDTGGYQVKPGNSMVTMKGDMAGGASVLGAMQAIAQLAPEHLELDVYLAATPNRIDAAAYVPDSIVNTTCGKKVEVRHTDAEGRLTLIDAVTMAEKAKPEVIITVATLTGAAMQAVGRSIALMGNHVGYEGQMLAACQATGDPVQPLAVTPEDFDNIKSKLDGADLRNTNRGTTRGAQTAAAFVMCGADETQPMVHLDIAGADMNDDETATGYTVRALIEFLLTV